VERREHAHAAHAPDAHRAPPVGPAALARRAARLACAAAAAAALLCAASPTAFAAAELTVSPLLIDVEAAAGDTVIETITAAATGDQPITVELVHADFGFDDQYQVQLIRDDAPETTAFSTRGWFSLPKERYRIAAGSSVDLPLRIDVPDNTPAGTYLGAALLRVVPPDVSGGGSQVQAVPETGPLVFIAVEGGEPPEAAMKTFDVPKLVSSGPLRPELVIENLGDEFFTFEGTVTLRGPGKDDTVEVSRQYVVPGEPRDIRTSADEKGRTGVPELGTKELGFGRYRVTARLRIEPVGTTLVATRTVWVVPTWARVVAAVALLAFLVCVWFLARWVSQRREFRRLYREELAAEEAAASRAGDADEDLDDDSYEDDLEDELSDDEASEDERA
jgi:hypothetical protein